MPLDELRRALDDYQKYARQDAGGTGVATAQRMVQAYESGRASVDDVRLETDRGRLADELSRTRKAVVEKAEALGKAEKESAEFKNKAGELEGEIRQLKEKAALSHLLDRVNDQAQRRLLDSPALRQRFEADAPSPAYVLSIDVRRSTELMLKAREPRLFAEFLIELAAELQRIICSRYGVFDKFTGDGILAFFPEFFSGPDAGYLALDAAAACHAAFEAHYQSHRQCFSVVLKDTGLGIGIDYGDVHIVFAGGQFTVVGKPVVYACRMAGAHPGTTLCNQPAYEKLFESYSAYCDFAEAVLDVKHEGQVVAYQLR